MKALLRDNRGSGIVTVMVAMLMITALGVSLLFTSYTGFRIKASERRSGENFYDAESVMSEIRAGIQQVVTESIAQAYEQVLVEYNTSKDTEGDFRAKFESALIGWTTDGTRDGTHLILSTDLNNRIMTYDPQALSSFIPEAQRPFATLTCDASRLVTVLTQPITDADGSELKDENGITRMQDVSLTLHGLSLKYVSAEGYESNVSTDVTITLPDFNYSLTEYSLTGVPEFAMVARESLTQQRNDVVMELTGSAYAGAIDLTVPLTTMRISGGTLICGGDVTVIGQGVGANPHLIVENSASLWAKRISVGANTAISLAGETYVADDLELAGRGASAALSGKYYGFGYLSDEELAAGTKYCCDYCGHTTKAIFASCAACGRANTCQPYSESVSSIVINAQNTSLDLSGVTDLVLAGNSFINTGSGAFSGSGVVMGQSVSVRSDQLAYLVPKECILVTVPDGKGGMKQVTLPSNPYSFSTAAAPEWTVDPAAVEAQGLSDYISVNGDSVSGVQAVFSNLPSTSDMHIVYFYLSFDSRADANKYFIDYFSEHSDSITNYLKLYSSRLSSSRTTLTSGTAYDLSEDGSELTLLPSSGAQSLSVSAAKYQERYENMCVTLSSRPKSSTPTPAGRDKNPFDYVVNRAALPGVTTVFHNDENQVAGIIAIGDCAVSQLYEQYGDDLLVIISTGSVTVDKAFTGLIVSDRTVTMNASMFSSPERVTSALRALDAGGRSLISYLNVGSDDQTGGDSLTGGATWDTYSLVSYSNWTKS